MAEQALTRIKTATLDSEGNRKDSYIEPGTKVSKKDFSDEEYEALKASGSIGDPNAESGNVNQDSNPDQAGNETPNPKA